MRIKQAAARRAAITGAVLTTLSLVGMPQASADPVAEAASGGEHWTIELPNPFGVEVGNNLAFTARETLSGAVTGSWAYQQTVEGETFRFVGRVSCLNVYDGNRAKLGGVVTYSNDPTVPVGSFGWFQVFDNGQGETDPPDRSSLVGFGDEAANEAFCNSPNLPRFGPWDVQGNVSVTTTG
jgi:hypothetical protein